LRRTLKTETGNSRRGDIGKPAEVLRRTETLRGKETGNGQTEWQPEAKQNTAKRIETEAITEKLSLP